MNDQTKAKFTKRILDAGKHPVSVFVYGAIFSAILSVWFYELWVDYKTSRVKPFIAVVASPHSVDFQLSEEFLRGFETAEGGTHFLENQNHDAIEIHVEDDRGSEDEAARIANTLAQDKNCILVIGNSDSALTGKSLDVFLQSGDPPAYILPMATADELLAKAKAAGDRAVLRMVPNAAQAETIRRLVKKLAPHQRAAIFMDEDNLLYSSNLSGEIASRIRAHGGQVVIEQTIGTANSLSQSRRAWQHPSAPEAIVYVGGSPRSASGRSTGRLQITTPVVFTDGFMVGSLTRNLMRIIHNRAFVLSPVAPPGAGPTADL